MDAVRGSSSAPEPLVRGGLPGREALRADLVERVREATPLAELGADQAGLLTSYCGTVFDGLQFLREPRYSPSLSPFFPWDPEEAALQASLLVQEADNPTGRQLKGEYRQLVNEVKRDRLEAERALLRLGEGTHRLEDGQVVTLSRDEDGSVRVRTDRADGSSRVVAYDERVSGDARIEETSADGQTRILERTGSSLRKMGDRVETTWSLDSEHCPVRGKHGPGYDDYQRTRVNPDGSTETRLLLFYSDEVEPGADPGVYEDIHQPPLRPGLYRDAGAARAIQELRARNPLRIDGQMMQDLVLRATSDPDGQAAGREYADLKAFVMESWSKLTPEAKQAWQVYERYVYDAKAKGQTGIDFMAYQAMQSEMAEVALRPHPWPRPLPHPHPHRPHHDAGAGKAIDQLEARHPQRIDGRMLQDLIVKATSDPDGQAAGAEYEDLRSFVMESWGKLSPEAKQVWQVYERYVYDAKAKGQTGLAPKAWQAMQQEMDRVTDRRVVAFGLEGAAGQPGPLPGLAPERVQGVFEPEEREAGGG